MPKKQHFVISVVVFSVILSLAISKWGYSQDFQKQQAADEKSKTDENPEQTPILKEIVVTATRSDEKVFDVPYSVKVIHEEEIRNEKMSRTTPDIFAEDPTVMVQKTSTGQASPFLRGFTGFRTLFLIDGIRLNNSVFRDGPNQYWNTVDPFIISRLEVVKGPSSVLYGSDAIGGTVNAVTRGRESFEQSFNWDRRLNYKFASADRSNVGRMELSGNYNKSLGILVGGAFKNFNDLTAGRYVGTQPKTGYDEINADFKMTYSLNEDSEFVLAYQRTDQNDAWRTHKTIYGISFAGTTVGDEKERSFDQNRDLVYLQYHGRNLGKAVSNVDASLSYHLQKEGETRVRSNDKSEVQGFDVGTLGLWTQANSPSPIGKFAYGLEYYHDDVDSYKTKYNADGTLDSIAIQGPVADDAEYDLLGIFVQDEIPLFKKLDLIVGARYTHADVDANKVEEPSTGDTIAISDNWDNLVGSGRLIFHAGENWNIYSGVSQGFRAPNLSDLTRFDSGRTDEIETPSPGLKPEKFISYEAGIKTEYERISGELDYFYTDIRDMIDRYPTGNIIDGDYEVQKANIGDGYIQGIEFKANYNFVREWFLFGGLAWQYGSSNTYPTSAQVLERWPMSRIQPLTGVVGLKWKSVSGRYWAEGVVKMAGKQDRLSPGDIADTQRIPPGGTPGYAVLDLRGGVKITKNLILSAGVENVTNADYRIHGSGQNEPGTNFIIQTDFRF